MGITCLLRFALSVGVNVSDFWLLTPAELFYIGEAWTDKDLYLKNMVISAGWWAARLTREKEVKPLKDYLITKSDPDDMTAAEKKAALEKLWGRE